MDFPITTAWAKLTPSDPPFLRWHPLLAHSADVAACFEALLQHTQLNQRLARLLDSAELSEGQIARLSALAALHDAGKANQGFQARARGGPIVGHTREILGLWAWRGEPIQQMVLMQGPQNPRTHALVCR